MTELVASAKFGASDDDHRAALGHMAQLSYVAVAQRNVPLADAIPGRCLQGVGTWTDESHAGALIKIGLIATAASGQDAVTRERLARYLGDLASLLPQGAPCRAFSAELEGLKTFTLLGEWHSFARAEALGLLGS